MTIAAAVRPEADEFAPFYAGYVAAVPDGDVTRTLAEQGDALLTRLKGLSEAQASSAYAPGKWTVKEVMCHITDTERIFAYRLLRIARGDTTPLASFDENAYAAECGANDRSFDTLLGEFAAVRGATLALLRWLPESAWTRRGTASGKEISVRGLAWIATGHERHHAKVLAERYGV
ncbi:MAG: DinB family protein [Gemmatimonadetes bacterium]|nr:DinB family protein [Gemmatimonadota bacterium]